MRNSTPSFLLAALFPLLPLVAGCNPGRSVTMADSFDLDVFGPHEDDLHSPYVVGAQFQITITDTNSPTGNAYDLTLVSSNPAVLTAMPGGSVTALSPGQTTLTAQDSQGNVLDSHVVTVALPDTVGIYAEGPLLIGGPDAGVALSQASIIAGGEATFLVRYFAAGTELYGNHALDPAGLGGVLATTTSASFASARDFLQVTPIMGAAGQSVTLSVGGSVLGSLPVTGVDPSVVTGISIEQQDPSSAASGDTLYLYAHAVDQTADDIYGVSFTWSANGQDESAGLLGEGEDPADLFFYTFNSSVSETVVASFDSFSPSTVVHGVGGAVGSTGYVGCSASGAVGTGGTSAAFALALAASGMLAARRRRPSRTR
jgi:hypothetical protein